MKVCGCKPSVDTYVDVFMKCALKQRLCLRVFAQSWTHLLSPSLPH